MARTWKCVVFTWAAIIAALHYLSKGVWDPTRLFGLMAPVETIPDVPASEVPQPLGQPPETTSSSTNSAPLHRSNPETDEPETEIDTATSSSTVSAGVSAGESSSELKGEKSGSSGESAKIYPSIPADEAKLDAWLRDYYAFHKRMLQAGSSGKDSSKFIVFQMMQVGIGNSLVALISCFLFAVVSQRILLIDFEDVSTVRQKGCDGRGGRTVDRCISDYKDSVATILEPPGGINWHYRNVITKFGFTKDEVKRRSVQVAKTPNNKGILDAFQCGDYDDVFPHQFLFFRSNTYWLTHTYHNPKYYSRLLPMLGTNPFQLLMHRIIIWKPSIQKELDRAPKLPRPVVCAHIRIATMRWEASNQVKAFNKHVECMEKLVESSRASAVYVAMMPTLRKKHEADLRSTFRKKKVQVLFHEPTTGNPLVDDLVELLRMMSCDEFVVSHSTISEVAIALRHHKDALPHLIIGNPPKSCSKQQSAEPCVTMWHHIHRQRLNCRDQVVVSQDVVDSVRGCWPYNSNACPDNPLTRFGNGTYIHKVFMTMQKLEKGSSRPLAVQALWKTLSGTEQERFRTEFPEMLSNRGR